MVNVSKLEENIKDNRSDSMSNLILLSNYGLCAYACKDTDNELAKRYSAISIQLIGMANRCIHKLEKQEMIKNPMIIVDIPTSDEENSIEHLILRQISDNYSMVAHTESSNILGKAIIDFHKIQNNIRDNDIQNNPVGVKSKYNEVKKIIDNDNPTQSESLDMIFKSMMEENSSIKDIGVVNNYSDNKIGFYFCEKTEEQLKEIYAKEIFNLLDGSNNLLTKIDKFYRTPKIMMYDPENGSCIFIQKISDVSSLLVYQEPNNSNSIGLLDYQINKWSAKIEYIFEH